MRVRLLETGGNDASAIGARVRVVDAGGNLLSGLQQVDGGHGRGGQSSPMLTFGLGTPTSNISIIVRWPNGAISTVNNATINSTVSITDPTDPVYITGTMLVVPMQGIEYISWTVQWKSEYAGDPQKDKVVITCPGGQVFEFRALDASTDVSIIGNNPTTHTYQELITPCIDGTYKVRGYTEVDGKVRTTPNKSILMPVCLIEEVIPE